MKRLRKIMAAAAMASVMAVTAVVPAFAGTWQNIEGSWYFTDPQDEGSAEHLTGWQWIDGYCYYLDPEADGAMAVLTITPDGFIVDADGHWINEFGIPYYLEDFGFSTSAGPSTVGMSYTDPALTGPAYADVPEEVRYPGDDVIVSGASRGSSSPSYGSLYGGISVQTIMDIRNAINQAENSAEETEEHIEGSGQSSHNSEEKSEVSSGRSEETGEKSEEKEESSSGTKESDESGEKTGENKEETGNTEGAKDNSGDTTESSKDSDKNSGSTDKGDAEDKEEKSEEKD